MERSIVSILNDIYFQFNNEFCRIRICYNIIHYLCTMHHLRDMYMLDNRLKNNGNFVFRKELIHS
jgi:hypothetical protein